MKRNYKCKYCNKTYAINYNCKQHEKKCKENKEKKHPTPNTQPETKTTNHTWTHLTDIEKKLQKRRK